MKKLKMILKNNILFIIIAFLSIAYVLYSCHLASNEQKDAQLRRDEMIEMCINKNDSSKEVCQNILANKDLKVDGYTVLSDIVMFKVNYLNPGAFLLVILPIIWVISNLLKNKFIINYSTRKSYVDFLKKFYKQAYKYCWLLPFLALLLLLYSFTKYSINPNFSIVNSSSIWKSNIIYHPVLFIILYMYNVFLYSIIYTNIALIICRKHHKFLNATILSILLFIAIQLFFEVVINILICQNIFHTEIGYLFNIMNIFTFSDVYGVVKLLIFTTSIFIITSLMVYCSYKNKEKLIIDCEKNK